ncbi:MAG: hypothetical protein RI945_69, partial [Candidatus Parcubacteria bacterium]
NELSKIGVRPLTEFKEKFNETK